MEIKGLHHFAWKCRDAEETRSFYEDLLGLPLVHFIRADNVPSTGENFPYVHLFFEMGDGSYLAFFDLGDNMTSAPSSNTPDWVNHIAVEVETLAQLEDYKAQLEDAGIDVVGITDHGFVQSIYFFDPNGIRLELTVRMIDGTEIRKGKQLAHEKLAGWTREKHSDSTSGATL